MAQLVKNLLAMGETRVWYLGWEDALEKGKATHSSILAWRIHHYFHLFPFYLPWSNRARCHNLNFFLIFSFKLAFPPSSSPSLRGSLVPLSFLLLEWNHPHIWGCWYFSYLSWFQLVTRPKKGPTFLRMCSAYRLNKQGDNRQPCQYSFLDPESISCSIHGSNS